jgi:hypothetical protein
MKSFFVIFVCLAMVSLLTAEPWELSVDASLMLTQNSYSNNWVGGEAGSVSWVFNSNSLAQKQLTEKLHNTNTLKLSFGQTHSQILETKKWAKPVKSTDLIDFETVFRFTLGAFVDPFVSGRLESQFLDQSDPSKDRVFNPMTLTETAGVAKVFIQQEKRKWDARLGFGIRQHIDRDVLIDSVNNIRETQTSNDGGINFITEFITPLAGERISFDSKLSLFKALYYSKSKDLEGLPNADYWKAVDVNWENIFNASISKYIMVSLYMQLLYDKEIELGGRFKQTLALGLTYKLI